ncbi:hypothetical protein T03_17372 [Trichinella britovi]|uniref:Uncharacterized protein n=1 Tax=Trichinella britovi TaxID=45882 RepID=A0A0V1AS89_TRIBR|nr:hypothetical protein T03_17372 [Trichinella britovi]
MKVYAPCAIARRTKLNAEGKCALPINDGSFFMVIMHFLYYGVECCKVVILKVGDIAPLGAVGSKEALGGAGK